jgi:hypothetical protein
LPLAIDSMGTSKVRPMLSDQFNGAEMGLAAIQLPTSLARE